MHSKDDQHEENVVDTRETIKRLVRYLKPESRRLAVAIAALLCSSAANLAVPMIMGMVLDKAGEQSENGNKEPSPLSKRLKPFQEMLGISSASFSSFESTLLASFGIFGIQSIASWIRIYYFTLISETTSKRMRQDIFDALLDKDQTYFDSNRTGEVSSLIEKDVNIASEALTNNVATLLRCSSSAINGTLMLLSISPQLTLVSVAIVPLFGAGAMAFASFVKRQTMELRKEQADCQAFVSERINNISAVRLYSQEERESSAFKLKLDKVLGTSTKVASSEGRFRAAFSMGLNASLLSVLFFGGKQVGQGLLSIGKLTSFAIYSSMVGLGFAGLAGLQVDISKALISVSRVFKLIDTVKPKSIDESGLKPHIEGNIRFEKVDFKYETRETTVLYNISLKVSPGEIVAITGPSGSGKSSLMALLCGLYSVSSGHIYVDNTDLNQIDLKWWRSHIGVVQQEPLLFSYSILENIRYSNPHATIDQVEAAADKANALEFIRAFPDGFHTIVGEGGKQLSGGEKQRIAIARAILNNPQILILDEATSSLDMQSEASVRRAISAASKGRTVFIIAHRRSTLQSASRIVFLQNGSIQETGTFDVLMRDKDSKLYKLLTLSETESN